MHQQANKMNRALNKCTTAPARCTITNTPCHASVQNYGFLTIVVIHCICLYLNLLKTLARDMII